MIDGDDLPAARSVLDVRVPDREDLLLSFVPEEQPGAGELLVTVAQDRTGRRVRVPVGEQVELVWQAGDGPRARDARVLEVVLDDEEPVWRLAPLGDTRSGQRRDAVRVPVGVRVVLGSGERQVEGVSLDLSEAGVRGRWPAAGSWPAAEDLVHVEVVLSDERTVDGPARVRRTFAGTGGWVEASLVFLDWPERAQDQVRARVFERLRQLARRGDL